MSKYRISTDKNELDPGFIHAFLSKEAYWCAGIPLETVKRCYHCLFRGCFYCFGASGEGAFEEDDGNDNGVSWIAGVEEVDIGNLGCT
jgi:hypothetical protein